MVATHDRLAADHLAGVRIVSKGRITGEFEAVVERSCHSITEARVVGTGQIAIANHRTDGSPSPDIGPARRRSDRIGTGFGPEVR